MYTTRTPTYTPRHYKLNTKLLWYWMPHTDVIYWMRGIESNIMHNKTAAKEKLWRIRRRVKFKRIWLRQTRKQIEKRNWTNEIYKIIRNTKRWKKKQNFLHSVHCCCHSLFRHTYLLSTFSFFFYRLTLRRATRSWSIRFKMSTKLYQSAKKKIFTSYHAKLGAFLSITVFWHERKE